MQNDLLMSTDTLDGVIEAVNKANSLTMLDVLEVTGKKLIMKSNLGWLQELTATRKLNTALTRRSNFLLPKKYD